MVAVPKTIDNDLPETDHCPGYGSAARFLAQCTLDGGRDAEAIRHWDPVKVVEVMGRNAGWLAAATALGARDERDAPHLIYVPERPFDLAQFLEDVRATHARLGYCVAVVAETVRDAQGRPVGGLDATAAGRRVRAPRHRRHGRGALQRDRRRAGPQGALRQARHDAAHVDGAGLGDRPAGGVRGGARGGPRRRGRGRAA